MNTLFMNLQTYLFFLLCLSSLSVHAQIRVDWTKYYAGTSFESNIPDNAWYVGAFPLPNFEEEPLLAYKYFYSTEDGEMITRYELINAFTGELTGDSIGLDEITPWNNVDTDLELNHLVQTADGYMSFVSDGNQLSFVKFDKSRQLLDPDLVGTAIAEFDTSTLLFRYTNMEIAPTSYGIVGTTMGFDEVEGNRDYSPFIFACDTNLNVRFAKRIEKDEYYFGNRFLVAVNAQDEIFTAAAKKDLNGPTTSDTLIVSKFASNGDLIFSKNLRLDEGSTARMLEIDLSEDESELLISGNSHGLLSAMIVRVNTEDGSLIKRITKGSSELVEGSTLGIGYAMAQYDALGNIVLVAEVSYPNQQTSIIAFQMDGSGKVLDQKELFFVTNKRPILWRFYRMGNNLYISGEEINPQSPRKKPFLAKLSTDNIGTKVSDDISDQISFGVFPNPTSDRLSIRWHNLSKGAYQLTLNNLLGQEMKSLKGYGLAGRSDIEVNLEDFPPGNYWVKLVLENGYAIQQVLKLE